MVVALAQGHSELADGSKVVAPMELQLGWLLERWGIGVLGVEPDIKMILKATQGLNVYAVFGKDHRQYTRDDWRVVKHVMELLEKLG